MNYSAIRDKIDGELIDLFNIINTIKSIDSIIENSKDELVQVKYAEELMRVIGEYKNLSKRISDDLQESFSLEKLEDVPPNLNYRKLYQYLSK